MAATHLSPQAMGGIGFNVESQDISATVVRLWIATLGHRLTGPGVKAVLARLNTYYGTTLSAPALAQLVAACGDTLVDLNPGRCSMVVFAADLNSGAAFITGLKADLTAAGNTVVS